MRENASAVANGSPSLPYLIPAEIETSPSAAIVNGVPSTWYSRRPPKCSPNVAFRPIEYKDKRRVRELHEEWFPVTYHDDFYEELANGRMASTGEPLFVMLAVVQRQNVTRGKHPAFDEEEDIIGCIVGSFVSASSLSQSTQNLLAPNARRHNRLFYIMTLGCVNSYRRIGLGTLLVQQCAQQVQADPSCGSLYLHVITSNAAAINFYERQGFHRVKEIENYYSIEGRLYNCYLYAKYYNGTYACTWEGEVADRI